jgi:DNA replicative helicase MCM subunit Mcm2 (Cdc46/Mcm family)
MAKLNFRDTVRQSDVDEALRLMDCSIRSLRKMKGNNADKRKAGKEDAQRDKMTTVMNLLRTIMQGKSTMTVNALLSKIHNKDQINLEKRDLMEVIDYCVRLQVLYVDQDEQVMFL